LPQWNCRCANCELARAGKIPRRTQSSVAISEDGQRWFLVNASPDLPSQIDAFKPLQPLPPKTRHSPIMAVLLTNADLDHVVGLLLMRQTEEPQIVCCSAEIRAQLRWIEPLVSSFSGIAYREAPTDFQPLTRTIDFRAISVTKGYVAYDFSERHKGRRCVIAPAVGAINADLQTALNWCDAMVFDGTFWSDDELKQVRPAARTAQEMGHLPVEQSVRLLSGCRAEYKVYAHINNTNPILDPASSERAEVNRAGITVGEDGMEFEL
jgi:pyrroloquinoline quinone biosynthesis protein B